MSLYGSLLSPERQLHSRTPVSFNSFSFNRFRTLFTLAPPRISRNSSGINRLRTLAKNNGEVPPLSERSDAPFASRTGLRDVPTPARRGGFRPSDVQTICSRPVAGEGGGFGGGNVEDGEEAGGFQGFAEVGAEMRELEASALGFGVAMRFDERAESGAVNVMGMLQIDDQFGGARREQLVHGGTKAGAFLSEDESSAERKDMDAVLFAQGDLERQKGEPPSEVRHEHLSGTSQTLKRLNVGTLERWEVRCRKGEIIWSGKASTSGEEKRKLKRYSEVLSEM